MLNAGTTRAALGLHVTLTGPFKPLSDGFKPLAPRPFPAAQQDDARGDDAAAQRANA